MKRITLMMFALFLMVQTDGLAHKGEKHENNLKKDARMEKLRGVMHIWMESQAKIDIALEEGDAQTVESECGKILATIPEMNKAKPTGKANQVKAMRKITTAFAGEIKNTAVLVKNGDIAGAKVAFANASQQCNKCHKILQMRR